MGKNMQHKDPANMQLQNGNSGGMNKLFHALNRRHRWQNVRKGLPDKRKGSGKHIIDGETTEPSTADTSQPPQVQGNRKKNKPQIEQSGTESGPVTKSSKKFRIRSLLSDEMTKRKGKGQRRSPSPTRSPSKRSDSVKPNEHPKTPTKSNCESPSTMKKRKTNICAAMLTVSYLRQKAQAYEQQNKLEIEEKREKNQQPTSMEKSHVSDGNGSRLTKSFSFPLLGSTKRKDFEIEELKSKLRDCKDKETTKEKFILPMNQWKDDTLFPKPMLTRPASFKSPSLKGPSSISQKENKQTTNQSKTLRQKIGRVMKDSKEKESRENRKKEKRRILMDAVFHKIPYGRRNLKDTKKVSPEKIKSNSTTSSTGSHRMAVDKANLKKTASTGEAMSKYRRLLSQRSIRDDKGHVNDHKPRLCVAGDQSCGTNERKTLKSIHSLPSISPSDFNQNQEFPVKTHMDTHQSIASSILDDHKSLDHIEFSAKINVPTPAIQKLVNETKLVDKHGTVGKNSGVGSSSSNHQEKNNPQAESSEAIENATNQTNLQKESEAFDGNPGEGPSTSGHVEKESSDAIESEVKETKYVDKDENSVVGLNTSTNHENIDHQKESSDAIRAAAEETEFIDENLGVSLDTSDHQEDMDNQMESSAANESEVNETNENDGVIEENLDAIPNNSNHEAEIDYPEETSTANESPENEVENDKSFNEILGMFKKVEQKKLEEGNEPSAPVSKVVIKCTIDHKDQSVDENLEDGENTLNHPEEESSPLTSGPEVEGLMQDSILESPSLIDIPHSPSEGISDENQQNLFSFDDEPSTPDQAFIHHKRPNNGQPMDMNAARTTNDMIPKNGFLHLDLESVKDNIEFQFVKEVLERSGFLENEVLGEWYSSYQPIDPLLFEELGASFLQTKNLEELDSMKDEEDAQKIINDHHLILFDLINEALLDIHNRTCTFCPNPLIYGSKVRPMPVGYRVLEEVWDNVNMYLSWRPDLQPSLDDAVTRDLEKGDGWMNLQADAEFVGIELEEMIADDLLDELVFDDLLM